jgi:hypothetical protein
VDAPIAVKKGQRYKVKRDYEYLNHVFRKDDEVILEAFAHSPKEGVTRYWFRGSASRDINVWHSFDGDATAKDFNATFALIDAA